MTSAKNDPPPSRDSGRGDSAQLDGDVTAGLVMLNLAVFILERQLSKTGLHAFQIRYPCRTPAAVLRKSPLQ